MDALAQRDKAAPFEDNKIALLGGALLMLRVAFSCCVCGSMAKLPASDLDLGRICIQHDLNCNFAHQVRMKSMPTALLTKRFICVLKAAATFARPRLPGNSHGEGPADEERAELPHIELKQILRVVVKKMLERLLVLHLL